MISLTLLDTETKERASIGVMSLDAWVEGNCSCDCNRAPVFGQAVDSETIARFGKNTCFGAKRFLVVRVEAGEDVVGKPDCGYLNAEYPAELLEKHGMKK